jgi:hypothetical protein
MRQCSDKGIHEIGSDELQGLFVKIADASRVFPECAPIGCEALNPSLPDFRAKAQQALLDVWLNLASGRLTQGRPIDFLRLTSATTIGEAVSELEQTVCDPDARPAQLRDATELAKALNRDTGEN